MRAEAGGEQGLSGTSALACALLSAVALLSLPLVWPQGAQGQSRQHLLGVQVAAVCTAVYLLTTTRLKFLQGSARNRAQAAQVAEVWWGPAAHLVVLVAAGWTAFRGPASLALLLGFDRLAALLVTVSAVSLLVMAGRWALAPAAPPGGNAHQPLKQLAWLRAAQLAAALLLTASLAWLETLSLPNQAHERPAAARRDTT
jgi:hypothetical protein